MDAELKAKWIAALESGKYKKGTSCLRSTGDTFCCLGVLCDIIDPSGWTAPGTNDTLADRYSYFYKDDWNRNYLPDGLDVVSVHHQNKLAILNDLVDSFAPVIEYIKENL